MNILYGCLAIVSALFISNHFSLSKAKTHIVFAQAFFAQFVFMSVLAGIFYVFNWGFLAAIGTVEEALKRVGGFAVFLGVLVAMRALNKRKMLEQTVDEQSAS